MMLVWKQMVDLPHGVVPPVLTNNFDVTMGGTHSAAGLGQNSFRHGSQADNCLGLEVVGEIWFGVHRENSELFYRSLRLWSVWHHHSNTASA